MIKLKVLLSSLLIAVIFSCTKSTDRGSAQLKEQYPEFFGVSVENAASMNRKDAAVVMNLDDIQAKYPDFNANAFIVLSDDNELASQSIDADNNGMPDEIIFVTDFVSGERKSLTIRYAKSGAMERGYPKRTQAELSHKFGGEFVGSEYKGGEFKNVKFLRVPPGFNDHSWYIRYEGPGWESDKVGYRFYLDWRNAIDIWGKKIPDMVLQNVGLDGFDSYHEMSDWGMDILKVGESLGIGSIAMWDQGKANRVSATDSVICYIVANGPVYSQIQTKYFGWKIGDQKYDLVSDLSITAGSRLTKHSLTISDSPANLCTGIVKLPETKLINKSDEESEWAYLATYGKQSLAEDSLGMAVLYKNLDLIELTEDSLNHVVILKPNDGKLEYYFLAAWEKEPSGIRSEAEFAQYLDRLIDDLNSPLKVNL